MTNCFLAGSRRNVYFPFDIANDTPMEVAVEMVKELEITDWEPSEIAEMIDGEISALVAQWKKWDLPHFEAHHTYNYKELEDYDDDEPNHPVYSYTSRSSSQVSLPGLMTNSYNWLKGMPPTIIFRC